MVQKWVFCPTGATHYTNKCEIWHRDKRKIRLFHAKFDVCWCRNVGTAPKIIKIWNLAYKFASRGRLFAQFLWNSQLLYASVSSFYAFNLVAFGDKQPRYQHFPVVEAFSHKFSVASSDKTTDQIWKSKGMQKWHRHHLSLCQSCAGCRRKCDFFVFLSSFWITKFVKMETPLSSVIFKTITVPLHREKFVVVHLYSSFSMDPRIFHHIQISTKNTIFCNIFKAKWWNLAWECRPGLPPLCQILYLKNRLRELSS